jgi:hypothetical protein
LIGKISREGVLYLDFSEHLEQYMNGDGDGDVDGDVVDSVDPCPPGKYIHFANFPSFMHVRFGAGGATSAIDISERLGSKRKSMTICQVFHTYIKTNDTHLCNDSIYQ